MARVKAGLSDSGWRQFNRQFVELVPFPLKALASRDIPTRLAKLATQIQDLQETLRASTGEGSREGMRATLSSLWSQLDAIVDEAYGLSADERRVASQHPRVVDRITLVERQVTTATDVDEADE